MLALTAAGAQVDAIVAILRERLRPSCAALIGQLQAAFAAVEDKVQRVPSVLRAPWNILAAQHWDVFGSFDTRRLEAPANDAVVLGYASVAAGLEKVRRYSVPGRSRLLHDASLSVLYGVSSHLSIPLEVSPDSHLSRTDATAAAFQLDAFAAAVSRQVNPHWARGAHKLTDRERQIARTGS